MAYRVVAYTGEQQPYPTLTAHPLRDARKMAELYCWLDEAVTMVVLVDAVTGKRKEAIVRG